MSVSYVVDGYNLLFHLGLLDRRAGASALEQARRQLLGQVREALGEGDHAVTVVFDSAQSPHDPDAAGVPGDRSAVRWRRPGRG